MNTTPPNTSKVAIKVFINFSFGLWSVCRPNINVLTNSTLDKVSGSVGKFAMEIKQEPEFVDPLKCISCGKCVEVCPASTINLLDDRVSINIKDCIRCYCCMEACENQAIVVRTPWLSKVVGMI